MIDNPIARISNSFPPIRKCIFLGLRFYIECTNCNPKNPQIVHIDGTVCNPRERFLDFEERNYWSLGTDWTIWYSDLRPQFFENHVPSWFSYHLAYVGMFAKANTFRDLLTKNTYKWKQFFGKPVHLQRNKLYSISDELILCYY